MSPAFLLPPSFMVGFVFQETNNSPWRWCGVTRAALLPPSNPFLQTSCQESTPSLSTPWEVPIPRSPVLPGCVWSSDFVQDFHLQSHPAVSLPPRAPVSPRLLSVSKCPCSVGVKGLRKPLSPCRSSWIAPRISLFF